MKLKKLINKGDFEFVLEFENHQLFEINLKELISEKIKKRELQTAKIDEEWGCLEFNEHVRHQFHRLLMQA